MQAMLADQRWMFSGICEDNRNLFNPFLCVFVTIRSNWFVCVCTVTSEWRWEISSRISVQNYRSEWIIWGCIIHHRICKGAHPRACPVCDRRAGSEEGDGSLSSFNHMHIASHLCYSFPSLPPSSPKGLSSEWTGIKTLLCAAIDCDGRQTLLSCLSSFPYLQQCKWQWCPASSLFRYRHERRHAPDP